MGTDSMWMVVLGCALILAGLISLGLAVKHKNPRYFFASLFAAAAGVQMVFVGLSTNEFRHMPDSFIYAPAWVGIPAFFAWVLSLALPRRSSAT